MYAQRRFELRSIRWSIENEYQELGYAGLRQGDRHNLQTFCKESNREKCAGCGDDRIGGRDILYFAADSDKAMLTAFATLTGNQLAAAGAVHLAVNRLGSSRRLCAGCEYTVDRIRGITGEIHQSTDGIGF